MSKSPILVAVFDTNAYVGLGRGALETIAVRESTAGVLALASVWPCLELLARCTSERPSIGRRAHAALRKVAIHAGYGPPEDRRLRLHEAGEFSLARRLFGLELQDRLLDIGYVGNLALAAAEMPLSEFLEAHSKDLLEVSERVEREERHFVAMTAAGMASHGRDGARQGSPSSIHLALIAAGLVQVLAEQHSIDLERIDVNRAVNLVVQNFAVALAFVYALIGDSPGSGGVPGRGNSHWDLKVAFHACRGASIGGAPVVLVSDDGRLVRAARDASETLRVVRTDEYQSLLDDPNALTERAAALSGSG